MAHLMSFRVYSGFLYNYIHDTFSYLKYKENLKQETERENKTIKEFERVEDEIISLSLSAMIYEIIPLPMAGMPDIGATLVEHAGIDKISFTGSEATGTKIMKEAANGIRYD